MFIEKLLIILFAHSFKEEKMMVKQGKWQRSSFHRGLYIQRQNTKENLSDGLQNLCIGIRF